MAKDKLPVTPAIRFLRERGIEFTERPYQYEERGGTARAARELGVDEHQVVKTLVMEDDQKKPILILMHGDREVSTRELARVIGARSITPCEPQTALKHTGYRVGGTSPFGTKKQIPIYIEETILPLPRIFINAGGKGLLAEMAPEALMRTLHPTPVRVAR